MSRDSLRKLRELRTVFRALTAKTEAEIKGLSDNEFRVLWVEIEIYIDEMKDFLKEEAVRRNLRNSLG